MCVWGTGGEKGERSGRGLQAIQFPPAASHSITRYTASAPAIVHYSTFQQTKSYINKDLGNENTTPHAQQMPARVMRLT